MRYHNISKDDMLNGEGLRVVLWVSGCEHHCPHCQNSLTWDPNDGLIFASEAESEIFEYLEKDYCSGITYSGGDPLFSTNLKEMTRLAKIISTKFPSKTQWLYTGYLWENVQGLKIMDYLDVIVDGRFVKDFADVNYHWAGSTNQRVIDVQKSLKNKLVILYQESRMD